MTIDTSLKELQTIPGVGPKLAGRLYSLGIKHVSDLKGKDPEELYEKLCVKDVRHVDRCVLYVFRGAVYYASHKKHNSKKLKWWNWKDQSFL
jgi:recombinational DNA repair protein RecR